VVQAAAAAAALMAAGRARERAWRGLRGGALPAMRELAGGAPAAVPAGLAPVLLAMAEDGLTRRALVDALQSRAVASALRELLRGGEPPPANAAAGALELLLALCCILRVPAPAEAARAAPPRGARQAGRGVTFAGEMATARLGAGGEGGGEGTPFHVYAAGVDLASAARREAAWAAACKQLHTAAAAAAAARGGRAVDGGDGGGGGGGEEESVPRGVAALLERFEGEGAACAAHERTARSMAAAATLLAGLAASATESLVMHVLRQWAVLAIRRHAHQVR
jgi:hypothetical protein